MQKYIITGTSKGIGEALALKALQTNEIYVTGIARTNSIVHPNYNHIYLDLENSADILNSIHEIFQFDKPYSRLVLINNAGYLGDVKYAGNIDSDEYRKVYAINLMAPAMLMNEFIKNTDSIEVEKIIINISSGAGRKQDYDGWSAYSSSKTAVDQLSQIVARECMISQKNYRIYAIAPGVVETQMQVNLRMASVEDFSHIGRFIKMKDEQTSATPEEVADKLLRFIVSSGDYTEVLQDLKSLVF